MKQNITIRDQIIALLKKEPNSERIASLVAELERQQPADLTQQAAQLGGVWELRWSSSSQPWLKQSPWLENLQVLDLEQQRGCNLLRLRGPLQDVGAIRVEASLKIVDHKRVQIQFQKGGWIGPRLFGAKRLSLMRAVTQSFPAWLDITVLDDQLRICKGNAGTTFALLRLEQHNPISDYFN